MLFDVLNICCCIKAPNLIVKPSLSVSQHLLSVAWGDSYKSLTLIISSVLAEMSPMWNCPRCVINCNQSWHIVLVFKSWAMCCRWQRIEFKYERMCSGISAAAWLCTYSQLCTGTHTSIFLASMHAVVLFSPSNLCLILTGSLSLLRGGRFDGVSVWEASSSSCSEQMAAGAQSDQ